jgi:hypothetical protein
LAHARVDHCLLGCLCIIDRMVVATLPFYIDVQHLMVSANKRSSEFGDKFDVHISPRHDKFRRDGLQQEPFEGVWTPDV